MFNILRYRLRAYLGQFPKLFFLFYSLKRRNRFLFVKKANIVCIEGYPRSANTFIIAAIEQGYKDEVSISHHLHVPAQVIRALKLGVPSIVLIRQPKDAIVSHIIRNPNLRIEDAIFGYECFYRPLIAHKKHFLIIDFDSIISEPNKIIDLVFDFIKIDKTSEFDESKVFNRIKYYDSIDTRKNNSNSFETVSIPTALKKERKLKILSELDTIYLTKFKELEMLYNQVRFDD